MLYYSKENKNKIVHFDGCPSAKRIAKENKKHFRSVSCALKEGYQLCRHCNPLEKLYEKDKEKVKDYCYQNLIALEYRGHEICLTTLESKWKVIPLNKTQYALYHANERLDKVPESSVHGYHLQEFRFNNLLSLCEYIVRHDQYRKDNPLPFFKKSLPPPRKGTKRWEKKERNRKRNKKKKEVRNVLKIINKLQEN